MSAESFKDTVVNEILDLDTTKGWEALPFELTAVMLAVIGLTNKKERAMLIWAGIVGGIAFLARQ